MTNEALLDQLRKTAHTAAWRAGQVIREHYADPGSVREKGPRDLVTDTDLAAQAAALGVIHERHPEHVILAEEDPVGQPHGEERWEIPGDVVWMVDPLDGTTNYTTGLPMVCTSVGVAIDGEPAAGVIYDPLREELFMGVRGQGASLNGRPLAPLQPHGLDKSVVSLDWAHDPSKRDRSLAVVSALAARCRTVRALGSAALGLAYVAQGRVDFYFNFGLQPWDIAAGAVIIREVGGVLCHPGGEALQLGKPAIFAAHPALLDEVLPLMVGL